MIDLLRCPVNISTDGSEFIAALLRVAKEDRMMMNTISVNGPFLLAINPYIIIIYSVLGCDAKVPNMVQLPQHIVDCAESRTAVSSLFHNDTAFLEQIFLDGGSEFGQSKSINSPPTCYSP